MPDAKGFSGSADKHRSVGLCADADKAQRDRPLKSVAVPRVSTSGAPLQSQTLVDFAAELAQGQLRALRVDISPERHLEGCWWLREVQGRATQATEQMACATDLFEVDWWIVEIKWYERVPDATDSASQTQGRPSSSATTTATPLKYKLLPELKRWVTVNALIRVGGLSFEGNARASLSGLRTLSRHIVADLINDCL